MGAGHDTVSYSTTGGPDNIVPPGYNVHIVSDLWVNAGAFQRPLLTTRVVSRALFSLHLRRLMNYAGAIHIATPDHDSIIAPVI